MIKASFEAKARARKEKKSAAKLLRDADKILREVDESQIFHVCRLRQVPTFERSEINFGKVLGVGGFCRVREVERITLSEESNAPQIITEPSPADAPEEEYYQMSTAKFRMAKYCLRDGEARYAVKQLHSDLTPLENARGMIDLSIEARFLGVISHPNIIKMRAVAACGPMNKSFFIVLDRLYATLEERIELWRAEKSEHSGFRGRLGSMKKKGPLRKLRIERLLVAYDLAAAIRYLHEQQLVFRDLKSENIGFDIRGDVKLFDFGLCKSLHPRLKIGTDGMYLLTPRTGSLPYMAPEVAQGKPYGTSADVFSFAILLWEILALRLPFKGFSRREYYEKICLGGLRPSIHSSWPAMTRETMKEAWNANPKGRPDMRRMTALVRADLNNLSSDPEVKYRTKHMKQRSIRSIHHRGVTRSSLPFTEHGASPSVESGVEEHTRAASDVESD